MKQTINKIQTINKNQTRLSKDLTQGNMEQHLISLHEN